MDTRLIRGEFVRKVIFSPVTKVVAFILAVACLVIGANTTVAAVERYLGEEEQIYEFEKTFNQTNFFWWPLREPFQAVINGVELSENGIADKTVEERIEEQLDGLWHDEEIDYYISFNGRVFTNCNKTETSYFQQARFSFILGEDDYGGYYWVTGLDELEGLIVRTAVKESYVQQYERKWQEQADYVWRAIIEVAIFAGIALVLIIYLISVAGKTADGEHRAIWIDFVWTELHLGIIAGAGIGAAALCTALLDNSDQISLPLIRLVCLVAVGLASVLIINSLLSVVRKVKCGKFLATSVIFIVLRWLFKALGKVFGFIGDILYGCAKLFYGLLTKKSGLLLILVMIIYTVFIAICGACLTDDDTAFIGIALGLILLALVCLVFAYRAREFDSVKKGAEEVKSGNMTYNISELRSSDLNSLAQDINEIAFGLDQSVSARVRAERMKTELITNVSHDLKTPLTSVINYTELLNNVENLPEEARDYAQIIAKKSDRLKRLTQDLFDISKIQSGNEEITFERIDISLLIAQSLGEHDGEIKKSELNFCVNLEKELYICADGRKMSRVISNLMSNVLKYAMKNTRVFVTASARDGRAVIEFKNTSAYPMDFDAQEITGRFVRGDKSRSVEGNGLGLAIVHSYTQAVGGEFEIVTDGDLFKAIISFPTIK